MRSWLVLPRVELPAGHDDRVTATRGLSEILRAVARRMKADFEASGMIAHRGSKGTVRESAVREFLESYVPRDVAVIGSSEVVDASGAVSGQCDVLLVDPSTPPLWAEKDLRVVPAECVHVVIEVKSNLTADELRSAWSSARKVKALAKTAYMPERGPLRNSIDLYSRRWSHTPTKAYVFAYDGATLETLGATFAELIRNEPDPALRLDSVFVLNRGSLVWLDSHDESLRTTARAGDPLQGVKATPEQVLMQLVTFLAMDANSVIPRRFDPRPYMGSALGIGYGSWPVD